MKEVRDKILVAERVVLQTIGFDLHISHPIGNCLEYLRALKCESLLTVCSRIVNYATRLS
jgi:hypothetical protein